MKIVKFVNVFLLVICYASTNDQPARETSLWGQQGEWGGEGGAWQTTPLDWHLSLVWAAVATELLVSASAVTTAAAFNVLENLAQGCSNQQNEQLWQQQQQQQQQQQKPIVKVAVAFKLQPLVAFVVVAVAGAVAVVIAQNCK